MNAFVARGLAGSARRHTVAILVMAGALTCPIAADAQAAGSDAAIRRCLADARSGADGWALSSTVFSRAYTRQAFVGNGYLSQRVPASGMGYLASPERSGWPLNNRRYTGAFVSGLYRAEANLVAARRAYAALPTWTTLSFRAGAAAYDAATPAQRVTSFRQTLFLRCGLLRTSLRWTTPDGRRTDLRYDVIADRTHPHLGVVHLRIMPHWTGHAAVADVLDGRGARGLRQTGSGPGTTVRFKADGTGVRGALTSVVRPGRGTAHAAPVRGGAPRRLSARRIVSLPVRAGHVYEFTKYVGVDTRLTSRRPTRSAGAVARRAAGLGWRRLLARHARAWARLWRADVVVPGRRDLQTWLRAGMYGLLSSVRKGAADSIAPAGLSSDNYAGVVFWDAETWMYPSLALMHPALARSILDYRYRTLAVARSNARKLDQQGAFFPWTSAHSGNIWTDCHSWNPPHCVTQIHLQGDIALATWQYYLATKDTRWLRRRGWPVLRGIATYLAGRVTANDDGTYSIEEVAGPDEYSNGVTDGVYTNAVSALALRNALRAARAVGAHAPRGWREIAARLRIPFDPQRRVFLQFEGYDGSTIKQADSVLLTYPLEWPMSHAAAANTLDYYTGRTDPDGPAMTDAVHAVDAAAVGEPGCATYTYLMRSVKPFIRAPFAQFAEARGTRAGAGAGSPAFDFLTGAGGFEQVFTHGLSGFRWRADAVHLDPMLPPQLPDGVELRGMRWRGRSFDVKIGARSTTVRLRAGAPFTVEAPGRRAVVTRASPLALATRRPDLAATDDLARCAASVADSEQPGTYAEAAVDGSNATLWAPSGSRGTLTVDLGRVTAVSRIEPAWVEQPPSSLRIQTSTDRWQWSGAPQSITTGEGGGPILARYVRVQLGGSRASPQVGIRELAVH